MINEWDGLAEVVAIADTGSFSRAASNLGMSVSHISRSIARLENRLQIRLFARTTRSVRLTETGRAFVERSRRIIQDRDELLSLARGYSELRGEFRVTCATTLGEQFVVPVIRQFANDHPELRIVLELTNRLIDLVGEGYDVGIRTGRVSDGRLVGQQIAMRTVELCASPEYLRVHGVPRSIEALSAHDCLIGTSTTWRFLERGQPRLFEPKGRWQCNSGAATVDAALAGMGICQLPSSYVRRHIQTGTLIPLLPRFNPDAEPIWAVYPERQHLSPKVRLLVDALDPHLQKIIDSA